MSQTASESRARQASRTPLREVASDADRLRQGMPLESGEALPPPPARPLH
ncbi:MAG TPA: hypothetical protein VIG88_11090 [Lysobacter sp.]